MKNVLLLICTLSVYQLQAAVYNITNGDVSGLIAAINAANSNNEYDTINLASGGTYTLTSIEHSLNPGTSNQEGNRGLPIISGQHADLTNSRGITFNGNGATIERASNVPNFGLFTIKSFAGVIFNDLTFKNARVNSQGGAVFMRAKSSVTFNNCIFENNESLLDVEGGGGCIYSVDLGEIFTNDCTFENNRAVNQGGVISVINTNIDAQNCVFRNNVLTVGSLSPFGGAIYMDGAGRQDGHFKFDNCLFEENEAPSVGSSNGGGMYLFPYNDQITEITNCTFVNNSANQGGGFSFSGGSGNFPDNWYPQTATSNFKIKFQNNTFDNNNADGNGGGAFIIKAQVIDAISDCIFKNNSANNNGIDGVGGGLFLNIENHTTTIENVIFENNRSNGASGLFFTGNGGEINACTFKANEANAFGVSGAGALGLLNNASTSVIIKNSTFNNNTSGRAGAIAFDQDGTADVYNCTFDSNIADRFGGAATVPVSDPNRAVSFTNSTFANNEANNPSNGQGGAIHSPGNGDNTSVTIRNCIFFNHTVTNPWNVWKDCSATLVDGGNNLFNYPLSECGCVAVAGTNMFSTDPLLETLADNGGPTETMALQSNSPAIDAGGTNCTSTDQRGATRMGNCDIGAYERNTDTTLNVNPINASNFDPNFDISLQGNRIYVQSNVHVTSTELINQLGQTIQQWPGNNDSFEQELQLKNALSPGSYFVIVRYKSGVQAKHFVMH